MNYDLIAGPLDLTIKWNMPEYPLVVKTSNFVEKKCHTRKNIIDYSQTQFSKIGLETYQNIKHRTQDMLERQSG